MTSLDPLPANGPALVIRQEERADAATDLERSVELDWDPATFGTLATEVPRLPRSTVEDALITALAGAA
ncbi:hypothetical protein [Microbacterium sp. PRC9]|uniref:hypothetical protein n=1 Tax=Microbacterium sp. PRC9 TaxID=2962591 RepID=UPI0028814BE3|nr:hypothetical protein [Microbacterium sp. PRC9]MDT0143912.1 hypothetical protein [Microbacterium sp. PRC9]